jgi:hypothetical protein
MSDDTSNKPIQKTGLPQAEDVLSEVSELDQVEADEVSRYEREYLEQYQLRSVKTELDYAHLEGIRDHYKHKGKWSTFLILAVAGMLLFQSFLLLEVGLGRLDFKDYEWLLPALLVQNLGQVIGLAVYAVKYLFSDITNQR